MQTYFIPLKNLENGRRISLFNMSNKLADTAMKKKRSQNLIETKTLGSRVNNFSTL